MYVLILYFYAGLFAKGDSVAVTYIPGFLTEQQCITAGNKAKPLVDGSTKEFKFVCITKP